MEGLNYFGTVEPGFKWREYCPMCREVRDYIFGFAFGYMIHCTTCEPDAEYVIHLPENIERRSHVS